MGGEELEAAPSSPKMNPNIIGVSQPCLGKLNYQRTDHDDPALKKTAFKINLAKPNPNNFDETNGPIYPYQSLLASNCRRTLTNGLLQEYLIKHPPTAPNNDTHGFTMLAPVDPLGHNYGIYTVTDQNPRVAKEIAIGRCFDGTSDGFSREMKADAGIALTFHCPERKINRESLFQRLQTNPGQTLAQMARDMRELEGCRCRGPE
ncbi:hypothetical protein WMY93_024813 [Mugilogobius chulae]|uniref:Cartilage intermediate layer protein 1/2 C-terminal domain-containing protein n=1 Tax=Mugilogobius chulae TaxID=88201 RepID=A0AAW0N1N6_9GOBI